MAYTPITSDQVAAKAPIDDALMGAIKDDLDYLYGIASQGGFPITFSVLGSLYQMKNYKAAIDISPASNVFTPKIARVTLKKSGISGAIVLDLRKVTKTSVPVVGIDHQLDGLTQSIANVAPALATQSITRQVAQISTQSIAFAKAALSVASIIKIPGTNLWQYNLTGGNVDADYVVGKSITFAGCSTGANNGTFVIQAANKSGGNNIVITNASGVAQTAAAGTAQLCLLSYNQTNPVNAAFVPGESALFAAHTTAANNGTFEIYKINQAGNNIWVFNATGVVQAAAAGTVDVNRFIFAFTVAADATDFTVGEKAKMASHTNALNNGNFTIVAVNSGGNNLVIYNAAGVVQGGVAGNVNTNRWTYTLSADPSANIAVGNNLQLENHTTGANNGTFVCKQVKRTALNNIVIYNEAGVAQAGVAGNTRSTRKLVKFAADQSLLFPVGNFVELEGCADVKYNQDIYIAPFQILEVNRGGGANYNMVLEVTGAANQLGAAGFVCNTQLSTCNTPITINADTTGNDANREQVVTFTNFINTAVAAGTEISLYITSFTMVGDIQNLTIQLQ